MECKTGIDAFPSVERLAHTSEHHRVSARLARGSLIRVSTSSNRIRFSHAASRGYILLTANPADFRSIHEASALQGRSHPGILLVYQDKDVRKDLTREGIVGALGRLLAGGVSIAGERHILNQWR